MTNVFCRNFTFVFNTLIFLLASVGSVIGVKLRERREIFL